MCQKKTAADTLSSVFVSECAVLIVLELYLCQGLNVCMKSNNLLLDDMRQK